MAVDTLIAELPDNLFPRIRAGFDALAQMRPSDRRTVVLKFLDSFEKSGDMDREWLESTLEISRRHASAVLAALSVAVGVLSQTDNGEEFISAGSDKLFTPSVAPAVREVAALITDARPRITDTIARRTLSAQTLPALESFDVSVDFRFGFDNNNQIKTGVPVAVVHIDTDARPELFLQMSRGDVEMLVEKLNRVLKQMDAATRAFEKPETSK